jgi:hypothetical protein
MWRTLLTLPGLELRPFGRNTDCAIIITNSHILLQRRFLDHSQLHVHVSRAASIQDLQTRSLLVVRYYQLLTTSAWHAIGDGLIGCNSGLLTLDLVAIALHLHALT